VKRVWTGVNYSFVITIKGSVVWIKLHHLGFLMSVAAAAGAGAGGGAS